MIKGNIAWKTLRNKLVLNKIVVVSKCANIQDDSNLPLFPYCEILAIDEYCDRHFFHYCIPSL